MKLSDDPRTLSMMGEATFRQKGEAFYLQLRRHYVPLWMVQVYQNAAIYGQGFYGVGLAGQQAATRNPFAGLMGNVGAGPWRGLP